MKEKLIFDKNDPQIILAVADHMIETGNGRYKTAQAFGVTPDEIREVIDGNLASIDEVRYTLILKMREERNKKKTPEDILIEIAPFINLTDSEFDNEEKKAFLEKLVNYIISSRREIESVINSISEAEQFLQLISIDQQKWMNIFLNDNSFLHANFEDLYIKYALFAKIVDTETKQSIRDELILNQPKAIRFSKELIYARIKHLMDDETKMYMRSPIITITKALRASKEFAKTYRTTDEKLLEIYPFDDEAFAEVFLWEENHSLAKKFAEQQQKAL